jgi:hypothetical protein
MFRLFMEYFGIFCLVTEYLGLSRNILSCHGYLVVPILSRIFVLVLVTDVLCSHGHFSFLFSSCHGYLVVPILSRIFVLVLVADVLCCHGHFSFSQEYFGIFSLVVPTQTGQWNFEILARNGNWGFTYIYVYSSSGLGLLRPN